MMDSANPLKRSSWKTEMLVLGLFLALILAMTYPLVTRLGSTLPADLGDPVYTIWAMNWQMTHVFQNQAEYFNGNNFFPHKGTLLYADYVPGLALLAAPFVLLTGSLIWGYNLLFLAGFLLCAWGMYRLALYLVRDRSAAFIAGLIFTFFNYRFAHLSHIELLFFGWMPLFFLCLFKWIDRPALRYVVGAGLCFVLQTWCCAYYGAFFAPFAGLAVVYMVFKSAAWRRPGFWKSALVLALVTLPFLAAFYLPFILVHERMFFSRGLDEVLRYSAQLQFYTSITRGTLFWGFLMPSQESPEWILYPGLVAVLLALGGAAAYLGRYRRELRAERKSAFAIVDGLLFLLLLLGLQIHKPQQKPGGLYWGIFPLIWVGLVALRVLWAFLRKKKRTAAGAPGLARGSDSAVLESELEPRASAAAEAPGLAPEAGSAVLAPDSTSGLSMRFFAFSAVFAFLLSLGPVARLYDKPLFTGPYLLLYKFLPGFQGMRSAGRFAVLMMLAISVLAAWAVARLGTRLKSRILRAAVVGLLGVLVLADYGQKPVTLAEVPQGAKVPPIYAAVKALPDSAVLIELPMPSLAWIEEDWRNVVPMYYSLFHGKRTANGYSGYYPPGYTVVRDAMEGFPQPRALRFLRDIGVDHVLIHTQAHRALDGQAMRTALRARPAEAELLNEAAGDYLFRLKPAPHVPALPAGAEVGDRSKWTIMAKTNRQQARLAVDGKIETGWFSRGNQTPGEYLIVDLGAPAEVGQVELVQGHDPLGYPRSFVVEGSLDRSVWFEMAGIPLGVPDVTAATIEKFLDYRMRIDFPPRTTRYVRIRLAAPHRTLHWSVYELHIRR
jgi:hypothetical protein